MTVTYAVSGMTCGGCARTVTAALEPLVEAVTVTRGPDRAVVTGGKAGDLTALNRALAKVGGYRLAKAEAAPVEGSSGHVAAWLGTYKPLLLVVGLAAGVAAVLSGRLGAVDYGVWMLDFMGMFFVLFAFFKLLNLPGFVQAYRGYDVVAKVWPVWGWVYPFVELALGVAYLLRVAVPLVNVLVIVLMLVGLVGVWRAVRSGQTIQCACLGTVFNLPMSTVTVVENGGMALMAALMLAHG